MGAAHSQHRLSLKHCRAVVHEAVAELGGSAATVFTGEEDGVLRAVQVCAGANSNTFSIDLELDFGQNHPTFLGTGVRGGGEVRCAVLGTGVGVLTSALQLLPTLLTNTPYLGTLISLPDLHDSKKEIFQRFGILLLLHFY